VYTAGASSFQGPVGVQAVQSDRLGFGVSLSENFVDLENETDGVRQCTPNSSTGIGVPGGLRIWDATLNDGVGGWRPMATEEVLRQRK